MSMSANDKELIIDGSKTEKMRIGKTKRIQQSRKM